MLRITFAGLMRSETDWFVEQNNLRNRVLCFLLQVFFLDNNDLSLDFVDRKK